MNRIAYYHIIFIAFFIPTFMWTSEEDVPKQHAIVYFSGRGDSFEVHIWDNENKKYRKTDMQPECLTLKEGTPDYDDKKRLLFNNSNRFVCSYANTLAEKNKSRYQNNYAIYTLQYADNQIDLYSCNKKNINNMIDKLTEISQNHDTLTLVSYDIGALLLLHLIDNIRKENPTKDNDINALKQKITNIEFHDPLLFPETARSLTVPVSLTIGGLLYGMPLLASIPTIWGIPAAPIMSFLAYFAIGNKWSAWGAKTYYNWRVSKKNQNANANQNVVADVSTISLPCHMNPHFQEVSQHTYPTIEYSVYNTDKAEEVITDPSKYALYDKTSPSKPVKFYSSDGTKMAKKEKKKLSKMVANRTNIPFFTKLWWKISAPSTAINACVCLMVVSALMHQDLLIEILQKYVTINR